MSHSRGVLHTARFCPWCGTDNIERDYYKTKDMRASVVEFVCLVCGVGWRLSESRRRQHANYLQAQERAQRIPTNGKESGTQFQTICKRKFKDLKSVGLRRARLEIGEQMRAWLLSEEALSLRGEGG